MHQRGKIFVGILLDDRPNVLAVNLHSLDIFGGINQRLLSHVQICKNLLQLQQLCISFGFLLQEVLGEFCVVELLQERVYVTGRP